MVVCSILSRLHRGPVAAFLQRQIGFSANALNLGLATAGG